MADNKLLSLTEIFNEKIFRVPDFQRGYSWQKTQLDDFWEDLENLKDNRIHYTGLLTIEPVIQKEIKILEKWQDDLWLLESGLSAYYVIDGQQRLTTSIILINQIIDLFDENEGVNFKHKEFWVSKFLYQKFGDNYKSYIFGYEKDNPSDEYFKTKILEQNSSSSDKFPEQTIYTANLQSAKNFFKRKLRDIEKPKVEQIFKDITQRFKFNLYEIDDELDVYVTFETMNNRGKPLSNLELLKNRLIYISTLLNEDQDTRNRLRKNINETWKTIYEFLGKNKDNPLDDDDFLRNHWILYFKYDRKESSAYAKFLLNKQFTAQKAIAGNVSVIEIIDYIHSLSKAVKCWFYLFNPEYSDYTDNTKEWLQKLNRLGMSAFPPLIIGIMEKETEENLIKLLKAAEQFIFLVFRLSQRQSNTQNSNFYRLANSFYSQKDNTSFEDVIKQINWLTQGEEGSGDTYQYHGWFDLEKFKTYIIDQYDKGDGYYSWNGLRYFLFEYELYKQNKANGNQKVNWVDFNKRKKEDTIEHIYPQTPKDEYWKNQFKDLKYKEKKCLTNSLGNLLLLSQSKNSELQNGKFSYKCKHENKNGDYVGYFNGSYSEISVSENEDWGPKEILERGREMISFMRD